MSDRPSDRVVVPFPGHRTRRLRAFYRGLLKDPPRWLRDVARLMPQRPGKWLEQFPLHREGMVELLLFVRDLPPPVRLQLVSDEGVGK